MIILIILFVLVLIGIVIYYYKKNVVDYVKREQEFIKNSNERYQEKDFG